MTVATVYRVGIGMIRASESEQGGENDQGRARWGERPGEGKMGRTTGGEQDGQRDEK